MSEGRKEREKKKSCLAIGTGYHAFHRWPYFLKEMLAVPRKSRRKGRERGRGKRGGKSRVKRVKSSIFFLERQLNRVKQGRTLSASLNGRGSSGSNEV